MPDFFVLEDLNYIMITMFTYSRFMDCDGKKEEYRMSIGFSCVPVFRSL